MSDSGRWFEEIWQIVQDDVGRSLPTTHEFPLTAMTRSIAEAIWHLPVADQTDSTTIQALDVGTGTGVHALFILASGHDVDAIDVSADAIRYAQARAERLQYALRAGEQRHPSRERVQPSVRFDVAGIDSFKASHNYGLITFNPPAYYNTRGFLEPTPVAQGVFVDDEHYRLPEASFLHRFFEHIVLPYLAPGGHVICSWPSLERRVVEAAHCDGGGRVMSAIEKLETWFPLKVQGDRSPSAFFNHEAVVDSDYGLHGTFWENLIEARERSMYSRLVDASAAEHHVLTFKFGILHLVRDRLNPTVFTQVEEL